MIYGHLTSEAYHFIILTCSSSFTLAVLHHLTCIWCAKLVDVQLWLRRAKLPQTLVRNKNCCHTWCAKLVDVQLWLRRAKLPQTLVWNKNCCHTDSCTAGIRMHQIGFAPPRWGIFTMLPRPPSQMAGITRSPYPSFYATSISHICVIIHWHTFLYLCNLCV